MDLAQHLDTHGTETMHVDVVRLFDPALEQGETSLDSSHFHRERIVRQSMELLRDSFPEIPGAGCVFVRTGSGQGCEISFWVTGSHRMESCKTGGWLLLPTCETEASWWIPQPPVLRRSDHLGHILEERIARVIRLHASTEGTGIALEVPPGFSLDWTIWRFTGETSHLATRLLEPLSIETWPIYLWGTKSNVTLPAGLYRYLIHGEVYTDDFVWPRKWKFHSELDAHGLHVALRGLEYATASPLYRLLRRQLAYSVIGQQAPDGGWHQGEWTDLMESHYRLHNAAMLLLATEYEETADPVVKAALERAAAHLAGCTDQTDIGAWFLHDSLEKSAEAMEVMREQTRTPWIPSRTLGKSPTNKLILNTHLDAIVALDRYRRVTGDGRYTTLVDSARQAAQHILRLRPAEPLYRALYWAIHLTLLPKEEAQRLPLPLRAVKRLAWQRLAPQMHRIKRLFPRLVMPGGLIERHIAPLHHDLIYHPVNVLDLLRYQRLFPGELPRELIEQALSVVSRRRLPAYWLEQPYRRFALVVWADALQRQCIADPAPVWRQQLAEAVGRLCDAGLGLPPGALGGDGECSPQGRPCPSPMDPRLRVVNLCRQDVWEYLVVNPCPEAIILDWQMAGLPALVWRHWADGTWPTLSEPASVPGRGWIVGIGNSTT